MGKHSRFLKTLRDIAFEHSAAAHPDLALMARELGRVVHQKNSAAPGDRLTPQRPPQHGLARWLLAERRKPAISVLVMAWPPNHRTPVHDHAGLWGLEMSLSGALEVQSYSRDPQSGNLAMLGHDWIGPGDATWFEGGERHAHRCRNLSRHDTALTLHVYGGDLTDYFTYEKAGAADRWIARPQRSAIAGHLRV